MPMMRPLHIMMAALALTACATHPTVSPVPLKQGESYAGITFSTENVLPMLVFRQGLTDYWDLGLRVGLPIYGTGIDITRLLDDRDNRSDLLNVSYGLNPNHNVDFTYYRISRKVKAGKEGKPTIQRLGYYGLRAMIISKGIGGGRSTRVGILLGGGPAIKGPDPENMPRVYRFQWEIGYFHDFSSMPFRALFSLQPFDEDHPLWEEQYKDYPHSTGSLPSEYSRLTGLSIRISFPLGGPPRSGAEEEKP